MMLYSTHQHFGGYIGTTNIIFKRTANFIFVLILMTGCAFDFEPDIVPIGTLPAFTQPTFATIGPEATIDPSMLSIPNHGTREDMLYYASLIGFGSGGNPSINDVFDPYLHKDPLYTDIILTGPPENADEITIALYGSMDEFEQAVHSIDNILNYSADPITRLKGDARIEMAWLMVDQISRQNLALFLKEIGANSSLYWNYEPAWLQAKMDKYPIQLLHAQFHLLQLYASVPDSDTWWWIQSTDPVGLQD